MVTVGKKYKTLEGKQVVCHRCLYDNAFQMCFVDKKDVPKKLPSGFKHWLKDYFSVDGATGKYLGAELKDNFPLHINMVDDSDLCALED